MAGAYTDQRLNLSKLGKTYGRKPRFQTGRHVLRSSVIFKRYDISDLRA